MANSPFNTDPAVNWFGNALWHPHTAAGNVRTEASSEEVGRRSNVRCCALVPKELHPKKCGILKR
jgi:hypothetical protein